MPPSIQTLPSLTLTSFQQITFKLANLTDLQALLQPFVQIFPDWSAV